jgi:hypothetical protein
MPASGSAFPATLAFQIRQLEEETNGGFKLDAIVTVIGELPFILMIPMDLHVYSTIHQMQRILLDTRTRA